VPVPAPKLRRRLIKSAAYVFSSGEGSEGEEVGSSQPTPEKESKAGPSRAALAPAPARREEGLFGSDEESEPLAKKDKGKAKEGKINVLSVFDILIVIF